MKSNQQWKEPRAILILIPSGPRCKIQGCWERILERGIKQGGTELIGYLETSNLNRFWRYYCHRQFSKWKGSHLAKCSTFYNPSSCGNAIFAILLETWSLTSINSSLKSLIEYCNRFKFSYIRLLDLFNSQSTTRLRKWKDPCPCPLGLSSA